VALDHPVDLADVAGDHGALWERAGALSLAGRGVAARLPVRWDGGPAGDEVAARLGDIDSDGPFPPVAMGALPFAPSERAEMVVPAVVVRRQGDGSYWLTVTGPDPDRTVDDVRRRLAEPRTDTGGPGTGGPGTGGPGAEGSEPRDYRLTSVMERGAWCRLVAEAARTVGSGRLDKVVLARQVTVVADRPLRPGDVARRLVLSHPSCMVFSIDGFVGASPELLVERLGSEVRSQPLAGTTSRSGPGSGDDPGDRLLSSAKERQEHRLVVDAVAAALAPFCLELNVPSVPALVPVGTLAHLGTLILGRLVRPRPTALDLVGAIHPSPAVGGTPRAAALDYIAAVEQLDRGRYAGPVGWVDGDGDGCWAVGIRSAQIEGHHAHLMAGVGVLAGSDPRAELAETDLKLQPMLAAIVRP
jgi:menaquinone-specific isochorismate synthase